MDSLDSVLRLKNLESLSVVECQFAASKEEIIRRRPSLKQVEVSPRNP